MKQFQMLRACILIVFGSEASIYINGKLWKQVSNHDDVLVVLGRLLFKKWAIIDSWDIVYLPHNNHVEDQNQLRELNPNKDIPLYEGDKSHGIEPPDTQRKHIGWFAWTDKKNELVYANDRKSLSDAVGTDDYATILKHIREIALPREGTTLTEYGIDKYKNLQELINSHKVSEKFSEIKY